jgi:hypothetical protein
MSWRHLRLPASYGETIGGEQMTKQIQRISPFLWFDNQAEEAVDFHTSIFPNSKIEAIV